MRVLTKDYLPVTSFYIDSCGANCTAHQGALTAYQEASEATNNWAIEAEYVNSTAHQWSVTGHGSSFCVLLQIKGLKSSVRSIRRNGRAGCCFGTAPSSSENDIHTE